MQPLFRGPLFAPLPNKSQVHAWLAVFQNGEDGTGIWQWRTETEARKKITTAKWRWKWQWRRQGKGKKTAEPRTTKWQNMNKNFVRPAAADKLKLMTILL